MTRFFEVLIWQGVFERMTATGPVPERTFHRQPTRQGPSLSNRLNKGEHAVVIGCSRGGRTSKIHALADEHARPVAIALTPGNITEISMAIPLMEGIECQNRLLADKAYDADRFRIWLSN